MRAKTKALMILSIFIVLDTLPIPVLPPAMVIVVLSRPRWFKRLVDGVYGER